MNLRQIVKSSLPSSLLRWNKRRKWEPIRQHYGALKVADCFSEIYRTKLWGEGETPFYSGGGSDPCFAIPYVAMVKDLIDANQVRKVVDLGCGDYRVGRSLRAPGLRYIGVDVVPELITYNQRHFGDQNVEFRCVNMIEDPLPDGDLCLIRQVLQHLANAEIQQVLAKCAKYRLVLVTEHVYSRGNRPNMEITHGPDNRATYNSGVFLNLPPFNYTTTPILELPIPEDNAVMRTVLVRL
jgi:SAM-dependent methyltransferase